MMISCSRSDILLYLSSIFSLLINQGRVSPCKTRVTRITTKVMKRIRLRFGKGCVSLIVMGMDKAAASDTTPRIPAHAEISGAFHPGLGSATVIKRLAIVVKRDAPNVQRNLDNTSTNDTARAYQTAVPKPMPPSCFVIEGN